MATFAQASPTEQTGAIFAQEPSGTIEALPTLTVPQPYVPNDQGIDPGVWNDNADNKKALNVQTWNGLEVLQSSGGFDFFEDFHVIPRSFDFGNLLSSQSVPIEVFSAFRQLTKEWTSFTNNAGAGTSLGGEPALPTDVDPMSGFVMTLDVDAIGEPFVDTTLDFFFNTVGTAKVSIMIQRIVLWGLEPELPYKETLGFLTNVYPATSGKEKRESVRKNPRQSWNYEYRMEQGEEAALFENLLFDFQARTYGVPVWKEDTTLTVAASAGASSITVQETAYRDFRVGGFVAIFTSQTVFDVLQIDTGGITATTLTFNSVTLNAYGVGTRVMPLAPSMAQASIGGSRWTVGLRRVRIRFNANDNDIDIGDLTAFSSYNSKLLLDNGNSLIRGSLSESFRQDLIIVDGETGLVNQTSPWDRHKRRYTFTLRAEGSQAIWEMRQMLHALHGKQISFYVPTDHDDLEVVANLTSATNTMDVSNVGYAQHVRERQPKSDLRVNFVDGSTPLLRAITGSSSPSSTVDQLTVDTNWPSTITPAEISRVDYLEKIRLDTDDIEIEYDRSGNRARMVAPVKTVFE